MSRIARLPVAVEKGVDVQIGAEQITVKGPLGTLSQAATPRVDIKVANGQVTFAAADESRASSADSAMPPNPVANVPSSSRRVSIVGSLVLGQFVGFRSAKARPFAERKATLR